MKAVRIIISNLIVYLIVVLITLSSGCNFFVEHDKKNVLKAYTSENDFEKFYTFKAEIRSIRVLQHLSKNNKVFELNVDRDYFEQQYGDDDFSTEDGVKRWESHYDAFNRYEFKVIMSIYRILTANGGYDLLQEGTSVIITANSYYAYVGWDYPVLSLQIGETTYLDFETGLNNYLDYVRAGFEDQ